jgi:hypothetical protein
MSAVQPDGRTASSCRSNENLKFLELARSKQQKDQLQAAVNATERTERTTWPPSRRTTGVLLPRPNFCTPHHHQRQLISLKLRKRLHPGRTPNWAITGLVTFYTVFVIDLASRRVQILGSTPHPEGLFYGASRADAGGGRGCDGARPQVLSCDRARKWSVACGVDCWTPVFASSLPLRARRMRTPTRNALCGRLKRNVWTASFQSGRAISGPSAIHMTGRVRRRPRLGGLLNFYTRAA